MSILKNKLENHPSNENDEIKDNLQGFTIGAKSPAGTTILCRKYIQKQKISSCYLNGHHKSI